MHVCANVVAGPEGTRGAVLLRAGEVVDGLELARERRPRSHATATSPAGPARLCRALGIGLEHGGADLVAGPSGCTLAGSRPGAWRAGPRVGLRGAPDRPWRFWLPGEPQRLDVPSGGAATAPLSAARHPRFEPASTPV